MIYDYLVIGKGLAGTAAAKYLAAAGGTVALLGPDEPRDPDRAEVFSSHYDQGRIQRMIGIDDTWSRLNLDALKEYPRIEAASGIRFHNRDGCLYVNPLGQDRYMERAGDAGNRFGTPHTLYSSGSELAAVFPDFSFPGTAAGLMETAPSGSVNPLELVRAQLTLFEKTGGTVIREVAAGLVRRDGVYSVMTREQNTWRARQVLLCPGAFVNFWGLTARKLDLDLKSETVLLAEVSEGTARRLEHLPSLLYEIGAPDYSNIYLIKPLPYPDGKYYLKMGCNLAGDLHFSQLEEVQQWFRRGDSDRHLPILKNALAALMPGLPVLHWLTARCLVSYTRHRKEYIGPIGDDLFVACGGNGYTAMCSDAIGKIAAHVVMHRTFPAGYDAAAFLPAFAPMQDAGSFAPADAPVNLLKLISGGPVEAHRYRKDFRPVMPVYSIGPMTPWSQQLFFYI